MTVDSTGGEPPAHAGPASRIRSATALAHNGTAQKRGRSLPGFGTDKLERDGDPLLDIYLLCLAPNGVAASGIKEFVPCPCESLGNEHARTGAETFENLTLYQRGVNESSMS